ncbi:Ubiquitin modifier 1 [Trichostrongylus colubriformis]|uniref:Late endosomal/lysosomal adaptor and MAPK and MTOR activator 5 n=1 Tax=Trichostrongylus colubriformis TaxID=6319 RepID=A0AAN8F1Q7_TRICO
MESLMDKKIDQLMGQPGMAGVCVADANGLPLSARGSLKPDVAPLASQLLTFCSQLEPSSSVTPEIVLSGDHNKVTFSKKDELILVLHQNS